MVIAEGYFDGNTIRTFGNIEAQKNQKVIVTILDEFVEEKPTKKKTARGLLNKYARTDIPNIMELEKDEWRKAAEKKHENT